MTEQQQHQQTTPSDLSAAPKPFIVAFDIATATGCCHGRVGSVPLLWTWNLDHDGKARPLRLRYLMRALRTYFAGNEVDAVYYEEPTGLRAMMEIGASEYTIAMLRGAIGVLEAVAIDSEIPIIRAIPVQDAREALTGQRTFSKVAGKSTAKDAVMRTVKMLGVKAENDHEADAYAVWHYACALHNPRIAHLVTPLFMGQR